MVIFTLFTPFIPEGVGRGAHYDTVQCKPTFHNLSCKTHVIGLLLIIINYSLNNNRCVYIYLRTCYRGYS